MTSRPTTRILTGKVQEGNQLFWIDDLLIDDVNEAKMGRNRVAVSEALEVILRDLYEVFRNRQSPTGGAPFVVVGPTLVDRFLTLPIDPTYSDGLYRPRTAYPSGSRQLAAYRARRG